MSKGYVGKHRTAWDKVSSSQMHLGSVPEEDDGPSVSPGHAAPSDVGKQQNVGESRSAHFNDSVKSSRATRMLRSVLWDSHTPVDPGSGHNDVGDLL